MVLYQDFKLCPGVNSGPALGHNSYTYTYVGKHTGNRSKLLLYFPSLYILYKANEEYSLYSIYRQGKYKNSLLLFPVGKQKSFTELFDMPHVDEVLLFKQTTQSVLKDIDGDLLTYFLVFKLQPYICIKWIVLLSSFKQLTLFTLTLTYFCFYATYLQ